MQMVGVSQINCLTSSEFGNVVHIALRFHKYFASDMFCIFISRVERNMLSNREKKVLAFIVPMNFQVTDIRRRTP